MRLSHEEYHLSKGTMSPEKSNFNKFNVVLDRYLENMMLKPCFGIRIGEMIPYVLASTGTEAVQLLAKLTAEKVDNEEYLPNKDGVKIPRNQVHGEFLYPDFEIFLHSKYTINLDNPFLIKQDNEIHILAEEGDNIWGENISEELNEFKIDVEDIILP